MRFISMAWIVAHKSIDFTYGLSTAIYPQEIGHSGLLRKFGDPHVN
ncbi:hypothetical protein FHS25_006890 [Rhizobium laguerreae]|uniref:Uncharacterized protein n=1 Tax=Rhizobium laguerreae TaxID=1076926 RepID=A0ABR6GJA0_9HYPH|nr:hypothetical protein [Rhizobium laguerreae]